MGDDEPIAKEVRIAAPPETIFEFLTDPRYVVRWMGATALLDPRPGGTYRVTIDERRVASGRYVEIVPNRRVVFTWGWSGPGRVDRCRDQPHPRRRSDHREARASRPPRGGAGDPQSRMGSLSRAAGGGGNRRRGRPRSRRPRSVDELRAQSSMAIDVQTDIVIGRPRREVAAFAADPRNAPAWYVNIKSARLISAGLLQVGSQIAFVAAFLGRRLSYIYEVVEFIEGARLVMRTASGPFAMETTYTWVSTADGGTRMTLRNRGRPSGFSWLVAPLMSGTVRSANRRDLARLKRLLESGGRAAGGEGGI